MAELQSSILALRNAIKTKLSLSLYPVDSNISTATELSIGKSKYPLDDKTNFITSDAINHSLRTIYQCWLHHDSTTTDYISDCEEKKIPVVSFLERTNLDSYLSGNSDSCDNFKTALSTSVDLNSGSNNNNEINGVEISGTNLNLSHNGVNNSQSSKSQLQNNKRLAATPNNIDKQELKKKRLESDPLLKQVLSNEVELIDHNKALRGSKIVDFSTVAKECEYKIIRAIKNGHSHNSHSHSHTHKNGSSSAPKSIPSKPVKPLKSSSSSAIKNKLSTNVLESSTNLSAILKNKDPIIILSPSASAMINMNNVKDFLQSGKFTDTNSNSLSSLSTQNNSMLQIVRNSKRFNRRIKFVIVNNVEKFFVKPEYWDRVVAVFTTGQEWQFKNYKINQPNLLFQKTKGFYINFNGDTVPNNVKNWNVEIISLDRNQRFKDRQISEHLWENLERFMASKGYK